MICSTAMSGVAKVVATRRRKLQSEDVEQSQKSPKKVRQTRGGIEREIQQPVGVDSDDSENESDHNENTLLKNENRMLKKQLEKERKEKENLIKENKDELENKILSVTTKSTSISGISGDDVTIQLTINKHQKFLHKQLHNYIKKHWFTGMKFFDDKYGEKICKMSLDAKNNAIVLPEDITREDFVTSWKTKLNRFFAKLRHGSEQSARQKYLGKCQ